MLVEAGLILPAHLNIYRYAQSAEEWTGASAVFAAFAACSAFCRLSVSNLGTKTIFAIAEMTANFVRFTIKPIDLYPLAMSDIDDCECEASL